MKKILLSLFVFGFLAVGVSQAQASVLGDLINQINSLRSKMTASVIDSTTGRSIAGTPTDDLTPRIMYWWGKVNQHVDLKTGQWETDPDGRSGANIDKLTYCKKWYPNTVEVEDYKNETINTWRAAGNTGEYSSIKMSYECVQETLATTVTIESNPQADDNGNVIIKKGETITITGFPNSLTGQLGIDYQRAFSFGPEFECYNAEGWVLNCTAQGTGTSSFYITLYKGDKTYTSNIIKVNVVESSTSSITVISPNGGETYTAGQQITIKWETKNYTGNIAEINLIPLDMKYGTGMTFEKQIPNTGSYVVTLPKTSDNINNYYSWGKNFKIEATIIDNNGKVITDLSDNIFTINSTGSLSPSITVLSPNGGETYTAGQQITVKWMGGYSPNHELIKVGLYRDIGGNYGVVTSTSVQNSGQTIINVPTNAISGKYKVIVGDSSYYVGESKPFTITSSTSNTLSTLSSPSVVSVNSNSAVLGANLISLGNPAVTVRGICVREKGLNSQYELSITSSGNCSFSTDVLKTGIYTATIQGLRANTTYIYRGFASVHTGSTDATRSDSNVAYSPQAEFKTLPIPINETSSIKIISPNGGETYKVGDTITVKWTSNNIIGNIAEINLVPNYMKTGNGITFGKDISNTGSYTMIIPKDFGISNDYTLGKNFKVNIVAGISKLNNIIEDSSDNLFTITSSTDIGCSAGAVYSSTTGQICPNSSGCNGTMYSTITGQLCPTTTCANGANNPPLCTTSSTAVSKPQCSDGIDNDQDGKIDRGDNQCHFGLSLYKGYISSFDSEISNDLQTARTLKLTYPRMEGNDVMTLQKYLGINQDGVYGYQTVTAVKAWQVKNGLFADGVFGPACFAKMYMELFNLSHI